ncbi:MAG: MGMT family protein [Candidatus Shapirobacteria bacterium]
MKGRLFESIRQAVSQIPQGKVATYGQVARSVGTKDARKVGWAVYGNKDPEIPCHRVVKKGGYLAENFSAGGWKEQKRRLKKEGVKFKKNNQVNLDLCSWEI